MSDSEYIEIATDVDGDGTIDRVIAEQYADGSIAAAADLDGDGLIDVATYDADGDGTPEEVWVTPAGYTSLEATDEVTVTETYSAEVAADGTVTETYSAEVVVD